MNNRQVKTRTQRRVEKRQALTVLGLALVALLASFVFGVMVGRRGDAQSEQVAMDRSETTVVPAPVTVVVPPPKAEVPVAAEAVAPAEETKDPLTFYDRLPNGEAPLGSGVNLPPAAKDAPAVQQPMPSEPAPAMAPVPASPAPVAEAAPAPVAAPASAKLTAQAGGGYGVQVGAFQAAADAAKLVAKLQQKGYPAVVAEADLGAKGHWYRVRVGPFDKAGAESAAARLLQQDKIKGFVVRL